MFLIHDLMHNDILYYTNYAFIDISLKSNKNQKKKKKNILAVPQLSRHLGYSRMHNTFTMLFIRKDLLGTVGKHARHVEELHHVRHLACDAVIQRS